MRRARRLKQAVKNSKVTADQIIVSFEEEAKKLGVTLPKSPVTISRHLNGKRQYNVEEAEAYAKILDIDPAEILFEPKFKNIIGSFDTSNWKINWRNHWDYDYVPNVRVPREFSAQRYRMIEIHDVSSTRHGQCYIYERNDNKHKEYRKKDFEYTARKYFDQLCCIGLENAKQIADPKNDKEPFGTWVIGCATPIDAKNFQIHSIDGKILIKKTRISKLDPIVMVLQPSVWSNFNSNTI